MRHALANLERGGGLRGVQPLIRMATPLKIQKLKKNKAKQKTEEMKREKEK